MSLQTFDNSSRGPLGAIKLLWSPRADAIVASIGALLTVLALAIKPSGQQLLSFPAKVTESTGTTASIGAARAFSKGNEQWSETAAFVNSETPILAALGIALFGAPIEADY